MREDSMRIIERWSFASYLPVFIKKVTEICKKK